MSNLKIYKHEGRGFCDRGSCVIVSAVDSKMAEQMIRGMLDCTGLCDEPLNVYEVEYATTQSSLIHIDNGDYDEDYDE